MAKLMNKFGTWLIAKPINAGVSCLLAALVAPYSILLLFISMLFILMVTALATCARGIMFGLSIIGWLLIPVIAKLILHQHGIDFQFEISLLYCAFFTWLISIVLLWQRNWVNTLWFFAAILSLIAMLLSVFIPDVPHYWISLIQSQLDLLKSDGVLPAAATVRSLVVDIAPWISSFIIANIFMLLAFTAYLGQLWQSRVQLKDMHLAQSLRLSKSVWLLVAAVIAVGLLDSSVYPVFAAILVVPLLFTGYSIWHYSAVRNGFGFVTMVLILCYIALIFYPPAAFLLLSLTALVDTLVDVRALLTKQNKQ
jgi:hypothetical protein